jgi:hypothetical protein
VMNCPALGNASLSAIAVSLPEARPPSSGRIALPVCSCETDDVSMLEHALKQLRESSRRFVTSVSMGATE